MFFYIIGFYHSPSNYKDVNSLKFLLAQNDEFYNSQIQQDSPESLVMLL